MARVQSTSATAAALCRVTGMPRPDGLVAFSLRAACRSTRWTSQYSWLVSGEWWRGHGGERGAYGLPVLAALADRDIVLWFCGGVFEGQLKDVSVWEVLSRMENVHLGTRSLRTPPGRCRGGSG